MIERDTKGYYIMTGAVRITKISFLWVSSWRKYEALFAVER